MRKPCPIQLVVKSTSLLSMICPCATMDTYMATTTVWIPRIYKSCCRRCCLTVVERSKPCFPLPRQGTTVPNPVSVDVYNFPQQICRLYTALSAVHCNCIYLINPLFSGVRIYSQKTWSEVVGREGCSLVEQFLPAVVQYYTEATLAENHAGSVQCTILLYRFLVERCQVYTVQL